MDERTSCLIKNMLRICSVGEDEGCLLICGLRYGVVPEVLGDGAMTHTARHRGTSCDTVLSAGL